LISLSPAILPPAKLCRPSITHPDFHAANVFVSTDSNIPSIIGAIDWQKAAVRPLFETVLLSVFDISATDVSHNTLAVDFEDPLLPSNIDELYDEI
jgi:aminoglycoside phosphotransferase (APT) family kinase protein